MDPGQTGVPTFVHVDTCRFRSWFVFGGSTGCSSGEEDACYLKNPTIIFEEAEKRLKVTNKERLQLIRPSLIRISRAVGVRVSNSDRKDVLQELLKNWTYRLLDHWDQSLSRVPAGQVVPWTERSIISSHESLRILIEAIAKELSGQSFPDFVTVNSEPILGIGPLPGGASSSSDAHAAHRAGPTSTTNAAPYVSPTMTLSRAATALPIVHPPQNSIVNSNPTSTPGPHPIPMITPNSSSTPTSTSATTPQVAPTMATSHSPARVLPGSIRVSNTHNNVSSTSHPIFTPYTPAPHAAPTPNTAPVNSHYRAPPGPTKTATLTYSTMPKAAKPPAPPKRGRPPSTPGYQGEIVGTAIEGNLERSEDPFWEIVDPDPVAWLIIRYGQTVVMTITGAAIKNTRTVLRCYQIQRGRYVSQSPLASEWPAGMNLRIPTSKHYLDLSKYRKTEKYKNTRDSFFDITSLVDATTLRFTINIEFAAACKGTYFLCAQAMRAVQVETLIERLRANPNHIRSIEASKHHIQASFKKNDLVSFEQVTLKDPQTLMRVQIPARGMECLHWGCFDLSVYLTANKNIRTWLCPRCNRFTPFSTLLIDLYFEEALQKYSDVDDIILHADTSITRKSEAVSAAPKRAESTAPITVISLDSDDDDDPPPPRPATTSHITHTSTVSNTAYPIVAAPTPLRNSTENALRAPVSFTIQSNNAKGITNLQNALQSTTNMNTGTENPNQQISLRPAYHPPQSRSNLPHLSPTSSNPSLPRPAAAVTQARGHPTMRPDSIGPTASRQVPTYPTPYHPYTGVPQPNYANWNTAPYQNTQQSPRFAGDGFSSSNSGGTHSYPNNSTNVTNYASNGHPPQMQQFTPHIPSFLHPVASTSQPASPNAMNNTHTTMNAHVQVATGAERRNSPNSPIKPIAPPPPTLSAVMAAVTSLPSDSTHPSWRVSAPSPLIPRSTSPSLPTTPIGTTTTNPSTPTQFAASPGAKNDLRPAAGATSAQQSDARIYPTTANELPMGPRVDVVAPLNEQLTGSSGDRTNTSNYQPIGARLDSPTSNGHQTNTQVEATTASNDQQAVILADASAPNERLVDFLPNTPTNTDLVLPPNQHTNSGVDDVPPAQATDFMDDLANIAETFTTLASLPSPLVSENPLNISNNEDTVPLNRDVGQLVPNLSDKNHAVDSMIPSGTTVEKGNAMDTTTTPNTSTINQATVSTPNVDTANNENPAAPGSAQDSPTSNTSNTTSNTYPKPTTPSSIPAKDPVNKFAMFVTSLLPSAQNSGRVLSLSTGSRDVPICLDSDDDDD